MLSDTQITGAWQGMLGAEIRAKYFADMSGRYLLRQQWGRWFTLLFASFNAVALLAAVPQQLTWIRLVLLFAQPERVSISGAWPVISNERSIAQR